MSRASLLFMGTYWTLTFERSNPRRPPSPKCGITDLSLWLKPVINERRQKEVLLPPCLPIHREIAGCTRLTLAPQKRLLSLATNPKLVLCRTNLRLESPVCGLTSSLSSAAEQITFCMAVRLGEYKKALCSGPCRLWPKEVIILEMFGETYTETRWRCHPVCLYLGCLEMIGFWQQLSVFFFFHLCDL